MDKGKLGAGIIISLTLIMIIVALLFFRKGGVVNDSIIINEDPRNLVLTLEDTDVGLIQGRTQPDGDNGYFVEFLGEEPGITREKIFNFIWVFSSEEKSTKFFSAYITDLSGKRTSNFGDDSFEYKYPGARYVIFRENNIVVRFDYSDKEPSPVNRDIKPLVKIIEQKIKKAAEEQ